MSMFVSIPAHSVSAKIGCAMGAHEMIETIVTSYLRKGATAGVFGAIEPGESSYVVTLCDEDKFLVWIERGLWHVSRPDSGVIGVDRQIIEAARNVLTA